MSDKFLIPDYGVIDNAVSDNFLIPDSGVLNGTGGAIGYTLSAEGGTLTVTGSDAGLNKGYRLSAEGATYTITGKSINVVIRATGGTYTITGQDATLTYVSGYHVTAESGQFAFSGQSAGLIHNKRLIAEGITFTETGMDAGLSYGRRLIAGTGGVSINVQSAGLFADRKLGVGSGSLVINGESIRGLYGYRLPASGSSLTITGFDADLIRILSGEAGPGSFVISGSQARLLHDKILSADGSSITITGFDASIGRQFTLNAENGIYTIITEDVTWHRSYIMGADPGSLIIEGDKYPTTFKTMPAPQIVYPRSKTTRIPRKLSQPRSVGSSSVVRTTYHGPERQVHHCPSVGTSVQYIDRYIYVDGSMTTATVFEMPFSWGDATPSPVFTLGAGAVIAEVNVWMLEEFNGTGASITIGRPLDNDELMSTSEIDPTFKSSFSTRPGKEYPIGEVVNVYITPGAGATSGRGVISIYII